MSYKLVVFDLDGTLTLERSSWYLLARHFGSYQKSKNNMNDYTQGKIDYPEFMRKDIADWGKKVHLSAVKKVLDKIEVRPTARAVIRDLRATHTLAIATTALDLLATRVAADLDIAIVKCNRAISDNNGLLTGDVAFEVDLMNKDLVVKDLAEELGYNLSDCAAVGDSIYD